MSLAAYHDLQRIFKRLEAVREAHGMLHWDMSVIMPPGGAESRGEQLAALAAVAHGQLTSARVGELIDEAERDDALNDWQAANLKQMKRQWRSETAIGEELVEKLTLACASCEAAWRLARAESDFKSLLPKFIEVLTLTREVAQAKAEALGCSPYDALLRQYEPDGNSAAIDGLFDDLAKFLPGFTEEVLAFQATLPPIQKPEGPFPVHAQENLGRRLMSALGFDFSRGRLDVSLHPFCGGTPDDVRITTRYEEDDFTSALMGVLHETGHALYELGLPRKWRYQPVGSAMGMSFHESQSLLIEMQTCRSFEFLEFAEPLIKDAFRGEGPAWEADNLYRLYTHVEKDFIRVDADEVTYPAHVILRYRLEKALVTGDLDPVDLPGAWNEGMKSLLGITPPNDRMGCLQDIHWYDGAIGYFPTYTLGAMTAAQLFDAAKRANPDIPESISQGDFAPLVTWLRDNVHSQGSRWSGDELLTNATGQPLNADIFKAHLKRRYLGAS